MAPKRKTKKQEEEEEDDLEYEFEPKKKAPAKKRAAPAKKKKDEDEDLEDFVVDDDADEEDKPKKPKRPKTVKLTEITDLGEGWTFYPPSLIVKDFNSTHSTKIAAFDFDGTLVVTKSGGPFARGADDWKLYNNSVPTKLKQYHEQGYKIVIFSNQGGIKSAITGAASSNTRARMSAFIAKAGVPCAVLMATMNDHNRKPATGMWDHLCKELMKGEKPDLEHSFFVGDSIDGGDEGFATAAGIPYRTEKEEFGQLAEGVDASGTANGELVEVFNKLAKAFAGETFKASAYKKTAEKLAEFPKKITTDKEVLKQVSALPGVGKGSMAVIQEFLTTGKVAKLEELPQDKVAAGGLKTKDAEDAGKFM